MHAQLPYLLLADDDADDRHFFQYSLEKLHHDVNLKEVVNGREAVNFLIGCPRDQLPGLIVLDYDMPFLNAAEVLLQLAPVPPLAAVPKIVWSHSHRHIGQCRALGAKEYFVKPASTEEMDAIMATVIKILFTHS